MRIALKFEASLSYIVSLGLLRDAITDLRITGGLTKYFLKMHVEV